MSLFRPVSRRIKSLLTSIKEGESMLNQQNETLRDLDRDKVSAMKQARIEKDLIRKVYSQDKLMQKNNEEICKKMSKAKLPQVEEFINSSNARREVIKNKFIDIMSK